MVNDNQIINNTRDLTHEATTIFIKENLSNSKPPELYDLDLEFAKTKNNKNRITIILLIVFTFIFSAAAYGVTKYIEIQNSRIPISINAFEDVNLREIFDKAKQYEKEMKNALRDLDDLYIKRDNLFDQLNLDAENAISIIDADNPANKTARTNLIKNKLKNNLAIEDEIFSGEILNAKARINSIQDKIDSYDTRILEKAKEQESIINNQQQRFDMEMEKSVQYYETKINDLQKDNLKQINSITVTNRNVLGSIKEQNANDMASLEDKYNPEFNEDYKFISDSLNSVNIPFDLKNRKIDDLMYNEGLLFRDDIKAKVKEIYQVESTFSRLKEIPYYNSPKQSIAYLEQSYYSAIDSYNSLINNVTPILKNKNIRLNEQLGELEQLNYFLTSFVKENRVNGLIIDPRQNSIKIFIDPIYKIEDGNIGYVYRNDSDFIGTIKFRYYENELIGIVEELVSKERGIEPFDMILVNLK